MKRFNYVLTVLLALLVGVLGAMVFRPGDDDSRGIAWGQDSVSAGYMIGMIGPVSVKDVPIVLVDTRAQVIMVYQYNLAREEMDFIQARTYQYDRQLAQFPPGRGDEITVEAVRRFLDRQGR